MKNNNKTPIQLIDIDDDIAGQRIDNFLLNCLKNFPKSMIYRIIRKGDVRVNKKRVKAKYKLQTQDQIRIPPLNIVEQDGDNTKDLAVNGKLKKVAQLEKAILFEDDHILVLNKPSGLAVHGGSGLKFGVIEALRAIRPAAKFLELVHRIDRDTSGVLLVAKKRSALRNLQAQFREKVINKSYLALTYDLWETTYCKINVALQKNKINSIVNVHATGKPSLTHIKVKQSFVYQNGNMPPVRASLVEASPVTGRTHQIRVHLQHVSHAIAGDDRYGILLFNEQMMKFGLDRLFLHAWHISFKHPLDNSLVSYKAPLDNKLTQILAKLDELKT